jgi:zinc protease
MSIANLGATNAAHDGVRRDVHLERLSSGLGLVVRQVPNAPAAAIQVWVGVGGADERDHERGLAHLHEHMLFKGTARRGVGEIAAAVEGVGGQINAWTSLDQTVYHVVMPAHEWRAGLDVLADAVVHSAFDATELEREIEVVCEEIRRAEDSPGRVLYRHLFESVFGAHTYALPVLGTTESVRSMGRDNMRAFWGRHYRAANTIVSVVGPMSPEEVRAAVEADFAAMSLEVAVERPRPVQTMAPSSAKVVSSVFSETRLAIGFAAPTLEHADVAALDILALILGQGESSRLFRRVRRDLGLVNEIGCSCWTPQRGGLFTFALGTSADRVKPAAEALVAEICAVLEEGVSAEDVDRAQRMILSDATWKLETVQGQANAFGFYAQATGDPNWEHRYHDAVGIVSADDVRRVALQWIRGDRAHSVLLVAKDAADSELLPDEATLLALTATIGTPVSRQDDRPLPTTRGDRSVRDGVIHMRLATGDRLLVLRDTTVPVFALRHAVAGGQREEDASTAGRGRLASELFTRGTVHRGADDIAFAVDAMAGEIGAVAGRNSFGMSVSGLAQHRDAMVDLGLECMADCTLPEDELEIARRGQLEDIHHQEDAPARRAFRAAMAALYGDHPYGLDILGSEASVQTLGRQDLLDWMRGRMAPGNAVWAACGDVDPDWLATKLEAGLSRDRVVLAPPTPAMPAPLAELVQLRLTSDKEQSHVVLAFAGATLDGGDRYALQVLSALLGGQGGRLFLDLRDRQSLAYSISASSTEGLEPGSFTFYIGTAPDKVETALAGLYGHIHRVRDEFVTAEELDRARRALAGGYAIGLQRTGARAASLCLSELYGTLKPGGWQAEIDALLAVTAEDVRDVAERYLTVGRHVEAVVGPDAPAQTGKVR